MSESGRRLRALLGAGISAERVEDVLALLLLSVPPVQRGALSDDAAGLLGRFAQRIGVAAVVDEAAFVQRLADHFAEAPVDAQLLERICTIALQHMDDATRGKSTAFARFIGAPERPAPAPNRADGIPAGPLARFQASKQR